jgi:hypothetical protein
MIKTQDHHQEIWEIRARSMSKRRMLTNTETSKFNFLTEMMETGKSKPFSLHTVSPEMLKDLLMVSVTATNVLEINATAATRVSSTQKPMMPLLVVMILAVVATGKTVFTLESTEINKSSTP